MEKEREMFRFYLWWFKRLYGDYKGPFDEEFKQEVVNKMGILWGTWQWMLKNRSVL